MNTLFSTGKIVATPGALSGLQAAGIDYTTLVRRHTRGDWGKVGTEDAEMNQLALRADDPDRIHSVYQLDTGLEVWVITEYDRSATTLLLPDEY